MTKLINSQEEIVNFEIQFEELPDVKSQDAVK